MKKKFLVALPIACAIAGVALTACGGGSSAGTPAPTPAPPQTSAAIGGTVSGNNVTILLKNNNETIAVAGNGNFTFNKKVQAGSAYNVTLLTQPIGESCIVSNGSGTVAAGVDSISSVSVACSAAAIAMQSFNVGVTVSGLLPGNSVVFANNGRDLLTVSDNGLSVFSQPYYTLSSVPGGDPGGYNVTVQTQPQGQTCTLAGATGAVSNLNFTTFVNVTATCK